MIKVFTIKLKHTKTGEVERFDNWKAFYRFIEYNLPEKIESNWLELPQKIRLTYEDKWEWFKDLDTKPTSEILWQHGYDLTLEKCL